MVAELISSLETQLVDSRRDFDMVDHVILGQGYIVLSFSGLPLDFDVRDKKVSNARIAQHAGRVLRMTKDDAENVASSVTDGAGRKAHAQHVRFAILNEISQREDLIVTLKAL